MKKDPSIEKQIKDDEKFARELQRQYLNETSETNRQPSLRRSLRAMNNRTSLRDNNNPTNSSSGDANPSPRRQSPAGSNSGDNVRRKEPRLDHNALRPNPSTLRQEYRAFRPFASGFGSSPDTSNAYQPSNLARYSPRQQHPNRTQKLAPNIVPATQNPFHDFPSIFSQQAFQHSLNTTVRNSSSNRVSSNPTFAHLGIPQNIMNATMFPNASMQNSRNLQSPEVTQNRRFSSSSASMSRSFPRTTFSSNVHFSHPRDGQSTTSVTVSSTYGPFTERFNQSFIPDDITRDDEITSFLMNLRSSISNIDIQEFYELRSFPGGQRGATERTINSIPTFSMSKSDLEKQKQNCAICLDEFKIDEKVKRLPCQHIFHEEEIVKWLKISKICPICKNELNDI